MKRRTNAPENAPSPGTTRPFLSWTIRRERADEPREPAIDWLAADPVFEGRVAASA